MRCMRPLALVSPFPRHKDHTIAPIQVIRLLALKPG